MILRTLLCGGGHRHKRAEVLAFLGLIFVINGWVLADSANLIAASPAAGLIYQAHLQVMSLRAWGAAFAVVGAAAIITAASRCRVPTWAGFAALQLLASAWGLLFAASYFATQYGRAWLGAIQWAAVVGVLVIVADWEDPPPRPPVGAGVL